MLTFLPYLGSLLEDAYTAGLSHTSVITSHCVVLAIHTLSVMALLFSPCRKITRHFGEVSCVLGPLAR